MLKKYGIIKIDECNDKKIKPLKICGFDDLEKTLNDDDIIQWARQKIKPSDKIFIIDLPNLPDIVAAIQDSNDPLYWAILHDQLSDGYYYLPDDLPTDNRANALLGFGLAHYSFDLKQQSKQQGAKTNNVFLVINPRADDDVILAHINAINHGRDLINTPANILTPEALAGDVKKIGDEYGATTTIYDGDILAKEFPLVHIVGNSSVNKPTLSVLEWGDANHKHVILIGKGVCFDSGGLDIKSSSNMLMMKKDMGGAAHMIALAQMIMATKLPIRLTLIIPAAENAVSHLSYRPSDVVTARNGQTVEIGNTDAEGRLLLADAISYAVDLNGDVIIDFATLTGAARVAVGTDLPACFCNDDDLWRDIEQSQQIHDPLWRLPLHAPYRKMLDSKIADIHSTGSGGYGGAITAALFLQNFVNPPTNTKKQKWLHGDIMAYNLNGNALKKSGGEIQGMRTLYEYLKRCFV